MGVTYDTGALIAADRAERRVWARHRALLAHREVPTVPSPVVAQGWRGGSRQALLARFLIGCDVEVLDDDQARSIGVMLARAAATDIVDGAVVEGALRRHDVVVSSDPDGSSPSRRRLADASRWPNPEGHSWMASSTLLILELATHPTSSQPRVPSTPLAIGARSGRPARPHRRTAHHTEGDIDSHPRAYGLRLPPGPRLGLSLIHI